MKLGIGPGPCPYSSLLRCIMQLVHLPVELQLLILTEILSTAEQRCSHLVQRDRVPLFILPLLLACKTFHNYLINHSLYNRIRLWIHFRQITKQDLPVTIAVLQGPGEGLLRANFTILDLHVRLERVGPSSADHDQQAFLVLEEQNMQSRGRLKHTKMNDWLVSETVPRSGKSRLYSAANSSGANLENLVTKTPVFHYHHFLENTLEFAKRNDLCVWIWKRSARFFSGHNIGVLVGGHRKRSSNRSIYLLDDREEEPINCTNDYGSCNVCDKYKTTPTALQFQFIVDSPRNGFLAYDRSVDPPRNFTQDMLSNNVHFFAGLG
ncbi:hypothetical protein BGW37DRAFT_495350 [Umbelopsis sp. PMI_123]|nr:hypothetical protein BGW37DRAFT_495350 [Umbelopsis sp. PMI_123]